MKVSEINKNDVIFILSVGGGNKKKKISVNIVEAIKYAKIKQIEVMGIVGKKDGETYKKFKAIQKAVSLGGQKSTLLNIIVSLPKLVQDIIYFFISKTRKIISYFLPS